jgi:hypothetical protein
MPGGPTNLSKGLGFYCRRRRDWNPLVWGIGGWDRGRRELGEVRHAGAGQPVELPGAHVGR